MRELDKLGQEVRRELGAPSADWLRQQRRALSLALQSPRPKALELARWWRAVALLTVTAVATAAWTFWPRAKPQSDERALTALSGERRVSLADGSSLLLAAETRARLKTTADTTLCTLDVGTVSFDVAHQNGRVFSVLAGDFAVRVVGTRFTVSRDASGVVEVAVMQGMVRVDTPLRATPTELRAGDRLWAHGRELLLRHTASAAVSAERIVDQVPPVPAADAAALPLEPPPPPVATSKLAATEAEWVGLYRRHDYAGALAAARRVGVDGLLESLAVQPLSELADAARLGGDADLALRAFDSMGRRFPTSRQAADALFLSGRLFANRGQSTRAQHQFEAYLARNARGAYFVEATGRLVEIYAAGRDVRAKPTARAYLQYAPDGPYQVLCHSVLAAP